jgi:flagellar basal-body rod protein FlgG
VAWPPSPPRSSTSRARSSRPATRSTSRSRGRGFFQIQLGGGGERATRETAASTSTPPGRIVTAEGYVVGGGISIPDNADIFSIERDGTVCYRTADDPSTIQSAGQIQLHRFQNPAGLISRGGNIYLESPASGTSTPGTAGSDGLGVLKGGYLERSNVDVVEELIKMIMAQRAYEVNSRAIKAGDEMMSLASRLGRS